MPGRSDSWEGTPQAPPPGGGNGHFETHVKDPLQIQIPQPIVLFDTGHADGDLAALRFVLSHLHS